MTYLEQGTEEYDEAFSLLSSKHRELVATGEARMYEGREGYPVLRWAPDNTEGKKPGALVPGTSIVPNPKAGAVEKFAYKGNYKRTNAWKELKEHLMPMTDDPEVYGGMAWLLDRGFSMLESGTVQQKASCPQCGWQFWVDMYKKGDSKALATLLDHRLGKPEQKTEVTGEISHIHDYLRERQDERTIEINVIDPKEVERRRKELEDD
jgi:hypothetical protein